MKASVLPIVRTHYGSLVDARTHRVRLPDHVLFEGVPIAVLAACWATGVTVPADASVGLLTVAGLLSAFLFGVMLQVAERALDWSDNPATPGPDTSRHARLLRELAANAGYASLVSIATAVAFVLVSVSPHTAPALLSAIALSLASHLLLVLLMVISRVFRITDERLTSTRTGASVTPHQPHPRSGVTPCLAIVFGMP